MGDLNGFGGTAAESKAGSSQPACSWSWPMISTDGTLTAYQCCGTALGSAGAGLGEDALSESASARAYSYFKQILFCVICSIASTISCSDDPAWVGTSLSVVGMDMAVDDLPSAVGQGLRV